MNLALTSCGTNLIAIAEAGTASAITGMSDTTVNIVIAATTGGSITNGLMIIVEGASVTRIAMMTRMTTTIERSAIAGTGWTTGGTQ